jgi:polysaccharide deacetylase family protein (PEP-CTERM system associated)
MDFSEPPRHDLCHSGSGQMAITEPPSSIDQRQTLLLSIDFEDWHQLVRRRVGVPGWEHPGPALRRQTDAVLGLLEQLRIRATFFVLGMAARAHPELLGEIVSAGHELGSHGDAHQPVHAQAPEAFAADLRAARETIEGLTGRRPVGYRAPAFSITRDSPWAYDVLASEGFAYDASEHDSPRIRDRLVSQATGPHPLSTASGTLWELPVAVWRRGRARVPVGGASYWGLMPTPTVLRALHGAGEMAGLYLHPYELDPEPLDPLLPADVAPAQQLHARLRAAQRNAARRRAPGLLRAIAGRYRLITYGEAYAQLSGGAAAGP